MKRLIKKYLLKKLKSSREPKHYHFLRWLADVVKDKNATKDVYSSIASWLYEDESLNKLLQFNDIFVVDNIVFIYTHRPALWIGKAGRTVDSLEHKLNHKVNGEKVHDYKVRFIEEQHSAYAEITMNICVLDRIYSPEEDYI